MDITNIKQLNKQLITACQIGDTAFIKEFIDSSAIKKINDPIPYKMFMEACNNGHLEIIKEMFLSPHLNKHINNNPTLPGAINIAFRSQHIDIIEFIGHKFNAIEPDNGSISSGIMEAAEKGHLNVIKHFLEKSTLDMDKDLIVHRAFHLSCSKNHLNIIKYLVEFSNVKKICGFSELIKDGVSEAYLSRSFDIVKYLIFDLNVPKNDKSMNTLASIGRSDFSQLENWFNIRELNQSLADELVSSSTNIINTKKPKI
jgi:hypothetical protein